MGCGNPVIHFPALPNCTDCPLHEQSINPGLPTRLHSAGPSRPDTVLLVVGEAPGWEEDSRGCSWVGPSGKLLDKFLSIYPLADHADIYLSNACRCRPPQNDNPKDSQITACRARLAEDLEILLQCYRRVVILCCGAPAIKSVTRISSITKSLSHQGTSLAVLPKSVLPDPRIHAFFTYHPASLFTGRSPGRVHAVSTHFRLLYRYLKNNTLPFELTVRPKINRQPPDIGPGTVVSMDIESYGILKGVQQTVFHPTKAFYNDRTYGPDQIVSVAFSFRDSSGNLQHYSYSYRKHIRDIQQIFARIVASDCLLVGQNLPFDILFLTMNNPVLARTLDPRRLRLDDLATITFLYNDQQPETGLKEQAMLQGIFDYSKLALTAKTGTATSPFDPLLHKYNALDSATVLILYESFQKALPPVQKNPVNMRIRSDILWLVIEMKRCGFTLDRSQLKTLHDQYRTRMETLTATHLEPASIVASGEGSDKSWREYLMGLLSKYPETVGSDPRVEITSKTRQIRINADNIALIGRLLPAECPDKQVCKALIEYATLKKQTTTYTGPLLTPDIETAKNKSGYTWARAGLLYYYPDWYPTPRYSDKSSAAAHGGTAQARFACKKPAAQTFPKPILKTLASRYPGGTIVAYDLSQIELRTAALLSGDPSMLEAYLQGADIHYRTAELIKPDLDPFDDEQVHFYRQLGKTLNFLVLYWGGPRRFQETVLSITGVEPTLDFCKQAIANYDKGHQTLRTWQQSLINQACRDGHLILPTGWKRTFVPPGTNPRWRGIPVNEIVNFPVQTIAAQLMQTAQAVMFRQLLTDCKAPFSMILQIHDSVVFDAGPGAEPYIDQMADKYLTNPPLLPILEDQLGRTVPITYEKEYPTQSKEQLEATG